MNSHFLWKLEENYFVNVRKTKISNEDKVCLSIFYSILNWDNIKNKLVYTLCRLQTLYYLYYFKSGYSL